VNLVIERPDCAVAQDHEIIGQLLWAAHQVQPFHRPTDLLYSVSFAAQATIALETPAAAAISRGADGARACQPCRDDGQLTASIHP